MKAIKRVVLLGALAGIFALPMQSEAGARVYVRFGPPAMKTVRVYKPAKPYRSAVWVSGHWTYKHGRYVYVGGYWTKKRSGYRYVQPKWTKHSRGYIFVPGHWVR